MAKSVVVAVPAAKLTKSQALQRARQARKRVGGPTGPRRKVGAGLLTDKEIAQSIARLEVPPKMQNTYRRALTGNRTAAIKAKCLDCQGYEGAVAAVRDCQSRGCPLWAVRPFQKAGVGEDGEDEGEES